MTDDELKDLEHLASIVAYKRDAYLIRKIMAEVRRLREALADEAEQCCRDVCRYCADGQSVQFSCGHRQRPNEAHWRHPESNVVCRANDTRIRRSANARAALGEGGGK